MIEMLKKHKISNNCDKLKGLDCGCGTGWHVKRFNEKGFIVNGMDRYKELIKQAKINNSNIDAQFIVSSADRIAFKDNTCDFIYFINMLHHLYNLEMQKKAFREANRLLKKGGVLFIQEVNEDTPFFKFYMKYIFPLTNRTHAGERDERCLEIKRILQIVKDDWLLHSIEYFTFFPNITPALAFPTVKKINAFL